MDEKKLNFYTKQCEGYQESLWKHGYLKERGWEHGCLKERGWEHGCLALKIKAGNMAALRREAGNMATLRREAGNMATLRREAGNRATFYPLLRVLLSWNENTAAIRSRYAADMGFTQGRQEPISTSISNSISYYVII